MSLCHSPSSEHCLFPPFKSQHILMAPVMAGSEQCLGVRWCVSGSHWPLPFKGLCLWGYVLLERPLHPSVHPLGWGGGVSFMRAPLKTCSAWRTAPGTWRNIKWCHWRVTVAEFRMQAGGHRNSRCLCGSWGLAVLLSHSATGCPELWHRLVALSLWGQPHKASLWYRLCPSVSRVICGGKTVSKSEGANLGHEAQLDCVYTR